MVTEQTGFLFRMYRHYRNGTLMKPGGILNQPNFYIEAMEIIDKSMNAD